MTTPLSVWLVVTAVGAVSFVYRLSFFLLFGWLDSVPHRVQRPLEFVGPSVIAALVLPAVLVQGGSVSVFTPELAAALVAAVVAWRTENVAATVAVGMVVLWTVGWLA